MPLVPRRALSPLPTLVGLVLLAAHASLGETVDFLAPQGRGFLQVEWREAVFWLSTHLLLIPGFLLLALGTAPTVGPMVRRRLEGSKPGPRALALFGLMLFVLAAAGHQAFLLGLPITNDEYSVDFGARVLLSGALSAPLPDPRLGLPLPFVFVRDGGVTSFDYPGALGFAALARGSGLGVLLYAALAALSGIALAWAAGRLDGRRGAWTMMAAWSVSPMVVSLSFTTHAQLVSRSFVALALACLVGLWTSRSRTLQAKTSTAWAAGLGIFAGLAFLCRPGEAACLLTPVAFELVRRAWHDRHGARRQVVVAALAWLPGFALWVLYNLRTTGVWWLQARLASGASQRLGTAEGAWERLGGNLGFNAMLLAIFFLGPAALVLAGCGLRSRGGLGKILAAGIALHLGLALLHDDTGLHLVGPIHYSEAAMPLLLLLVLGTRRLRAALRGLHASREIRHVCATAAVFYLVAMGLFTATHFKTLRAQAEINALPLKAVAGLENAVVLARKPQVLWKMRPELDAVRSWTGDLPPPDPFLRDPVLFAYEERADLGMLRARFPQRDFYRMTYHAEGDPVRVELLHRGP